MGYLTERVERLRRELAERPPEEGTLRMRTRPAPTPRDLPGTLTTRPAVVAELKRAAPWAPHDPDAPFLDAGDMVAAFDRGGATAACVAVDPHLFDGSPTDVRAARRRTEMPLVARGVFVHPAQVLEVRAEGADAVLLHAAEVSVSELRDLAEIAADVGMSALVEAASREELERAVELDPAAIVVSARGRDGHLDREAGFDLLEAAPATATRVLEGGIASRGDVMEAAERGADAVLVSTAVMRVPNPALAIRRLLGTLRVLGG